MKDIDIYAFPEQSFRLSQSKRAQYYDDIDVALPELFRGISSGGEWLSDALPTFRYQTNNSKRCASCRDNMGPLDQLRPPRTGGIRDDDRCTQFW